MTRLNNCELVLGKLLSSLLNVLVMLAAAFPLFILVMLFGGVSLVPSRSCVRRDAGDGSGGGKLGVDHRPVAREDFSNLGDDRLGDVFLAGMLGSCRGGGRGTSVVGCLHDALGRVL